MTSPTERLAALGITLPTPAAPVANYVGFVTTGNLVFVSGQLPFADGKLVLTGAVGRDANKDDAKHAARQCGINLLAQLQAACAGDLARLRRVVKLSGFIACDPSFTELPHIMNGASDLMVDVFGDAGRHARTTVGLAALPLNATVEVEGFFEIA